MMVDRFEQTSLPVRDQPAANDFIYQISTNHRLHIGSLVRLGDDGLTDRLILHTPLSDSPPTPTVESGKLLFRLPVQSSSRASPGCCVLCLVSCALCLDSSPNCDLTNQLVELVGQAAGSFLISPISTLIKRILRPPLDGKLSPTHSPTHTRLYPALHLVLSSRSSAFGDMDVWVDCRR